MQEELNKIDLLKKLTKELNKYREAYYNYNEALITDELYDELFDKLVELEKITGVVLSDSPTQNVGYEVQSKLNKVTHDHPMLSLSKTKDSNDIVKFANKHNLVSMLKMDGLTCSLSYDNKGILVKAETRGNGEIGEDVLANIKQISNIPLKINNNNIPYTIDGEVVIDYNSFNNINNKLPDCDKYSHPRNLAAGSIRQLDTKITKERNLSFVGWRIITGTDGISMSADLEDAKSKGFDVVPYKILKSENISIDYIDRIIDILKNTAKENYYPIDGIVFSFDDIKYGLSLGNTDHHPQHSIAYKFYDDCYETILKEIIWQPSRNGILTPVAKFNAVEIDGSVVERASLHNISIIENLKLGYGDTITVYKANAIIPQINSNLTKSNTYKIPAVCPCCGSPTVIKQEGITKTLYCTNNKCSAKDLAKFSHYVSKECMNIEGLSDSTLEKLINLGFIHKYKDIYHLMDYKDEIINISGFGEKSYNNLINSIEKSKEVTLERFINAIGIPLIGKTASRAISKQFNGDIEKFLFEGSTFDYTSLEGFGESMDLSIKRWMNEKIDPIEEDIIVELKFIKEENSSTKPKENNYIKDKNFVVTGKFNTVSRSELEKIIVNLGGKLNSSVSKNTDYLLTNDTESGSSKNKKAKELGIPILSEEEFFAMVNN